jgi:hypothetical protein
LVAVVFLSVVQLVGSVASRVVAGEADSEASAKAVALGMCDFASVEGGKADVSEVDNAVTPSVDL